MSSSVIAGNTPPPGYRFPGGRRKALVMSYDDGSEHDRRLVALFNRYGIRGTFHLNSGKLDRPYHVAARELRSLYRGHEVSCHTVTHPDLTRLDDAAARREILDDKHMLEDLTGGPVRGMAYPFGAYNPRLLALLPGLGIEYARTVSTTGDFKLPRRFLEWAATCHHNQALEAATRFLQSEQPMALLYVWGHSYELDGFMSQDPAKNWDYLEALCRLLRGDDTIYYATAIEIVDYLHALAKLEITATGVRNSAAVTVWIERQGIPVELKPGTLVSLEAVP